MLKKILATSVLSASILGMNAGISEAASPDQQQPQVHVYTQVAQVQVDQSKLQEVLNNCAGQLNGQLDPALQNKIQELLKQVSAKYGQKQQNDAPKKAEQPEQKPEKAEKPAPTPAPEQKQEKVEKPAPAPEKEAAPAPQKQTQPEPEQQPAAEQPAPEKQPAAQQPTQQQPAEQPAADQNKQTGFKLTADEQQMVDLVNAERKKAGLAPLKVDPELTKMARVKAKDMIQNNYFSHNSPTYGSPFDMMKQFGIQYSTAGENIAGNSSVQGAHTALMNSEGHRANILGSQYTKVGIGIVDGGPYGKMFAQEFIG